jgi:hypothetical protein
MGAWAGRIVGVDGCELAMGGRGSHWYDPRSWLEERDPQILLEGNVDWVDDDAPVQRE